MKKSSSIKALRWAKKPVALQLAAALLITSAAWASTFCKVLTPSECVKLNSGCSVGDPSQPGHVSEATKTPQCDDGTPGMTECHQDGTNMVDCTYSCRLTQSGADATGRVTRVPKYVLGGVECGN